MQSAELEKQNGTPKLNGLRFAFCISNNHRSRPLSLANNKPPITDRGKSRRNRQSGYLLLVLLIAVALLSIAAAAVAPSIAQQIRRDREDELIHRGKQYAQAIKRYYTKFHRYPANLDQLMDTNGIHFLRKRYADPFTGKDDWKLVHQGEATIPNFQFGAGPGIPGGVAPTAMGTTPGGMAGINPAGAGVSTGLAGATGYTTSATGSTFGNTTTPAGTSGGTSGSSGSSTTTGNVAGQTSQARPGVGGIVVAELVSNVNNPGAQGSDASSSQSNQTGTAATGGTNSGSNSTYIGTQSPGPQSATGGSAFGGPQSSFGGAQSTFGGAQSTFGGTQSSFGSPQPGSSVGGPGGASPFGTNSAFAAGQQLGGGAIIGVASTSTQQSIREFNGKSHYNEWAFIYDPRLDTRPTGGTAGGTIGQPVAPGQNGGSTFGGSTFGQPATGTGMTSPTTPPPPQPPPTQPPL